MKNTSIDDHFLQSQAWADYQRQLGKQVVWQSGDGWSYQAIVEASGGLKRLYCPYGPSLNSTEALSSALDSLHAEAKQLGAHYVRVQPSAEFASPATLKSLGLNQITYSQPAHTWRLDLTAPIEDIYAGMKQNTRNICRNYQKKGLSYRISHDPREIKFLIELLGEVASHNKIRVHEDNYFKLQAEVLLPDNASLHFIEYQNQVIAAALAYQTASTWYYAHAAASFEHRKLGASTALVGEMINSARQAGAQIFDFYGITNSTDPNHPWSGFTRFKQSFGGYPVDLGETYELPVRKLPYYLFRFVRSLRARLKA